MSAAAEPQHAELETAGLLRFAGCGDKRCDL